MPLQIPRDTSVDLAPESGAQVQSEATPELLAGGKVKQAQQLSGALAQVQQAAVKYQEDRNLAKVAEAERQIGDAQRKFEDEILSTKGWQADGVSKKGEEFWTKLEEQVSQGLENDAQRQALRAIITRRRESSLGRIGGHERKQIQVAASETLRATIANDINAAISNAYDPQARQEAITDLERKTAAMSKYNGWDEKRYELARIEHLTAAHKGVITALMKSDPKAAEMYYKEHKKEIAGPDRAVIEQHLESQTRLRKAQEFSDKFAASGKDYSSQLEAARAIEDPEVRKLTVSLVKQREAERRDVIRQQRQEAWQQSAEILANGGSLADIPGDLWDKLGGENQLRVKKLATGLAELRLKQGDPDAYLTEYFKLLDMASSNPAAFKAIDLAKTYEGLIPEQRLIELKKLQTKPEEHTIVMSNMQTMKSAMAAVGIDPKYLTKKGSKGEEARQFAARFQDEVAMEESLLGRKAKPEDVQRIADRLTIKVLEDGWFGTTEVPAAIAEVPGVPMDQIDDLAAAVKNAGQPVTPANIKALYDYLQQGGK